LVSQNWKPPTKDNNDGTVAGAVMAQTSVGGARDGSAKKSCGKGNFSLPYEGIMNHHHPLIYGQNHYLRQNFGDCSFEPLLGNSWHL